MRIFSGIQPTGRKHLGNYIGAIRSTWPARTAARPIYCIVDLHAMTVPYEPAELRERVYDTTAILLAAGLDPERCILFRQGDVAEHTELAWLLRERDAFGDLNRMHQFKEKSGSQRELVSAGLFFYPVLRPPTCSPTAPHEVPVGDDQRQHIELMRDIAERFNARFGEVARGARAAAPGGRRADHGPAGPDGEDVDDRRLRAGHRLRARRAGGGEKKFKRAVTDSGAEVAARPTSRASRT